MTPEQAEIERLRTQIKNERRELLAQVGAWEEKYNAERKWWIERIEQERDRRNALAEKAPDALFMALRQQAFCFDDLLTSVRERGGK